MQFCYRYRPAVYKAQNGEVGTWFYKDGQFHYNKVPLDEAKLINNYFGLNNFDNLNEVIYDCEIASYVVYFKGNLTKQIVTDCLQCFNLQNNIVDFIKLS